jgi:uncharacterized protein YjeT (DUF2065 family)
MLVSEILVLSQAAFYVVMGIGMDFIIVVAYRTTYGKYPQPQNTVEALGMFLIGIGVIILWLPFLLLGLAYNLIKTIMKL